MFSREKMLQTPDKFDFPFEPYSIQLQFMKALYGAIELRRVGIFESPTGTGKSLSLTCGALKWLYDNDQATKDELNANIQCLLSDIAAAEKRHDEDWITSQFETIKQKERLCELKKIAERNNEHDVRMQEIKERKIRDKEKKWKRHINKGTMAEDSLLKTAVGEKESDEDGFLIEDDINDQTDNDSEDNESHTNFTQIFYCSRTHSQLSQVVNEIKNTVYGKTVRVVSLASRQNYCINDAVRRLKSNAHINERCVELQKCKSKPTVQDHGQTVKKAKVQNNTKCPFYGQHLINGLRESSLTDIMDIEELVQVASVEKACPYYASRLAARDAHIVLLPYQMLLHDRTRQQTGLRVRDAVVIIDEAHNLLDTISNIYSAVLTMDQLQQAHQQLLAYKAKYFGRFSAKNLLKINQLIFVAGRLVKILATNNADKSRMIRADQLMAEGEFFNLKLNDILTFCEQTQLAQKVHGFGQKCDLLAMNKGNLSPIDKKSYLQQLAERRLSCGRNVKPKETSVKNDSTKSKEVDGEQFNRQQTSVIRPLLGFLECLMIKSEDGRVLITYSDGLKSKTTIKYLLLNPSGHFAEILTECRALIIAGGTMQPTAEFIGQLFGGHVSRIEEHFFGHVVPKDAVLPMVVDKGPTGRQFSLTFANRTNKDMLSELATTLQNVCSVVPAGVVCFFGSYDYMDLVYGYLAETGVLASIKSKKTVFKEPRNGNEVDKMLQQYGQATRNSMNGQIGGAFLLSVVGGKLSEGLNFADDLGRCVIVVGLPFPNKNSPELVEKLAYLDKTIQHGAGAECYENMCMKAVNQCIGRAVRHIKDYAAVLLIDHRYTETRISRKLPNWIGESLKCPPTFGLVQGTLAKFFKERKGRSMS